MIYRDLNDLFKCSFPLEILIMRICFRQEFTVNAHERIEMCDLLQTTLAL